jgi:hypothetical protein
LIKTESRRQDRKYLSLALALRKPAGDVLSERPLSTD